MPDAENAPDGTQAGLLIDREHRRDVTAGRSLTDDLPTEGREVGAWSLHLWAGHASDRPVAPLAYQDRGALLTTPPARCSAPARYERFRAAP